MAAIDTVGTVETLLDALDKRDGGALAELLDGDVAYDDGLGVRAIGAEAVRDALIRRASALDERHGDRVLMQAEGRIAVETTLRGRYETTLPGLPEATEQSYSVPACLIFEFQGGRVARITRYLDSQGFLESLAGEPAS